MNPNYRDTTTLVKDQLGQAVDEMMRVADESRRQFARRWYDNNYFDDGYHFRYMSRTTNKIVDLSERQTVYNPIRAIPKASRQIRGIANLLLSSDPTPVVYPDNINMAAYPPIPVFNPQTGQQEMQPNPEYQKAKDEVKRVARLSGHWIMEEFKRQSLMEKLAFMVILAAKHGVSYLQIYPDAVAESIKTTVYDAFDIYLMGNLTSIYDSPFIIKGVPQLIGQIKANEMFDPEQVKKISPDNKLASSDIKEAYMNSRYGNGTSSDQSATLILKEAYIKEYLNRENGMRIARQEEGSEILKDKKQGDQVIRQVFSAGNVCLLDKYVKLPEYPFVDVQLEPGPIYKVPMMERFIPANKSLDLILSRLERFTHTMVAGSWLVNEAEGNLNITNQSGGQIIKYKAIPPTQANIQDPGQAIFALANMITSFIEEQGVTTTTLGKLPTGVKSGNAIESLKESEYANLVISSRLLKGSIKRIAERFLDIADDYFVKPKTVYYVEKGEPQYFDVIGASALKKRQQLGIESEGNFVPLKREYAVDIEIQAGAAFTREGKKEAAKQMLADLMPLMQMGVLPQDAFKVLIEKYLEMYQFGATDEFMEALEKNEGTGNLTETQLDAIKVAVIEVFKDLIAQKVLPDQNTRVEEAKVGAAEAIRDTGLAEKSVQRDPLEEEKMMQEMKHKEEKHQMTMQSSLNKEQMAEKEQEDKQNIEKAKTIHDMALKEKMAEEQARALQITARAKARAMKNETKESKTKSKKA